MRGPLVVVTDSPFPTLEPAERILATLGAEVRLLAEATPEAIVAAARQADAVLVTYAKLAGDVIRQFERCRIISRFGIGVDNVDIEAATQKGIVVTRVPDYCVDEVSDHALALLLALARKVPLANQTVQAGQWSLAPMVPLHRLRGRTLGLAGFGQIPRALAPKAQALGLQVIAYDPYVPDAVFDATKVRRVDLDGLLAESDMISIHAPLTPETRHMFGREAFRKIKPGAVLVNTARGPLVDEEALVEALQAGRLAGAALDVLEQEPPAPDSGLRGRNDVILTPHIGFYSVESMLELETKATEEVVRVLRGERPRTPVNPQVLER